MDTTTKKAIYTVIEKTGGKPFWLRIGWAHENRDGSLSLTLDALPLSGRLQVRDWSPRDELSTPVDKNAS